MREEDERQQHDQHDRRHDEAEPADQRAERAAEPEGAVDRELRRRRPGQQAAGRVRVLEGASVHPALSLDDELAQERDVGRRAAEPGEADARPLAGDPRKRHADLLTASGRVPLVSEFAGHARRGS